MSVVGDLEFAKLRKNQQLFNLHRLIVNESMKLPDVKIFQYYAIGD